MKTNNLKNFMSKIENFYEYTLAQQIVFFGYYLQVEEKSKSFNHKNIEHCFKSLDLHVPLNLPFRLMQLKASGELVSDGNSYRVSGPKAEKIKDNLGNPHLQSASGELEKLYVKLGKIENDFLREALDCFKVKAWHAVIVLVWIITIDHLQDYTMKKGLIEFNEVLQQNGNYRNIA